MDSRVVVTVAIVVAFCALIVVVLVVRRRHRQLLAALTDSQRVLHEQCLAADKAVRAAQRTFEQSVKNAKAELKRTERPERLAAAGIGNYVTPIHVCLNNRSHDLSPDVEAVLDAEGNITAYATQRSTLTRIVTGAVIAGPGGAIVGGVARKNKHHKADTRELYLMVTGPNWQEVAKLNPTQGDKARALMQAINVAAKNAPVAMAEHTERVMKATQHLDTVTADTEAVDLAKSARAALGRDPLSQMKANRGKARGSAPAPSTPQPGGIARFGDARPGEGPQDVVR